MAWTISPRDRKRIEDLNAGEQDAFSKSILRRLKWNEPAKTVLTKPWMEFVGLHPQADRTLTALELARVQTFPDTWRWPLSCRQTVRLVGEAVPPTLAYTIAKKLI